MDASHHTDHVLFHVDYAVGVAFFWTSTFLAVMTAILQGMVTALTMMTENTNRWTFRFRLARYEHWWWAMISILLLISLAMVALSFGSGNGGDAISVLALSSATFLAIVRYALPAWQHRNYTQTRWLAWTGPGRSAIKCDEQRFCGDTKAWGQLLRQNTHRLSRLQPTPSDDYGWSIWSGKGFCTNPVDLLSVIDKAASGSIDIEKGEQPVGIYTPHDESSATVSLLWGHLQGFQPVVSRAISSMPLGLLASQPATNDGYDGQGLTTAMGILGRNKGLEPWKLVFNIHSAVSSHMETASTWSPRPAKVLRSFYKNTLQVQYGGLGQHFVNAAVELALILCDIPHWAIDKWLQLGLEHQSLSVNRIIAECSHGDERKAALAAHYESSYVSMILSLNYMSFQMKTKRDCHNVSLGRPDLLCTAILLKASGSAAPLWWNSVSVQKQVNAEIRHMPDNTDWRMPMAKLLGLDAWPGPCEKAAEIW